jgi:uncharacterized membrane protein
MLMILTAVGLAVAAGFNAYLPLLAVIMLSKYTDFFSLPNNWSWLENNSTILILGALTVVEFLADKIAAVDSLNDVIQTFFRPISGGMLFTASTLPSPAEKLDQFVNSPTFMLFIFGAVIALVPHLIKLFTRPILNSTTGGMVAPLVSFGEDLLTVALTAAAVFIPVLVPVVVIALMFLGYRWVKALTRRKQVKAA